MKIHLVVLLVATFFTASPCAGQQITLWDTVRDYDRSAPPPNFGLSVSYSQKDLATLVSEADLIVEGTVKSARAALNDEETLIMNTYELQPGRVFYVREPSEAPRSHSKVMFQHVGGTLEMLGMKVSMYDESLRPFTVNERLVLFLKRSDEPHKYNILSGPYGCFSLRDGRLATTDKRVKRTHAALEGADVSRLASEIQTILRQRAR